VQGLESFVGYSLMLPHEHPGCFVQEVVPRHCGVDAGGQEPAFSWDRYALAPDEHYRNKQDWVLAEFWVSLSRTTLVNTSHSSLFSNID
jgi:hypothetical protein